MSLLWFGFDLLGFWMLGIFFSGLSSLSKSDLSPLLFSVVFLAL